MVLKGNRKILSNIWTSTTETETVLSLQKYRLKTLS